jgi:GT2 family glycosyltransferase
VNQLGLFDPRYFLYYEELDYCFAARNAGWKVRYFPDTTVVHIGGESAKSDAELTAGGLQIQELQIESELLYFRKNHGRGAAFASVVLSTAGDAILMAKHVLKGRDSSGLSSYWRHAREVWRSFRSTRWGTAPTR